MQCLQLLDVHDVGHVACIVGELKHLIVTYYALVAEGSIVIGDTGDAVVLLQCIALDMIIACHINCFSLHVLRIARHHDL